MERIREVAVTRVPQVEREPSQVGGARVDALQCGAEPQTVAILVNAQSSLVAEDASQMKRRTVYRPCDVIERQVFREADGQKQTGHLSVPAMDLGRRCAAASRLDAACLVGAADHSIEKTQRGFLNCQIVFSAGEQETAKSLVQEKIRLTTQRLLELERLPARDV